MTGEGVFFERLKEQKEKDLPFIVYNASSDKKVFLRTFFQHAAEVYKTTTLSETGFVFAPFDNKNDVILFPREKCEVLETVFDGNEEILHPHVSDKSISETNSNKDKHINLVQKGIDAITHGQFKKVVLSRKELVETRNLDSIVLFQRLLIKYPDAFVYFMHHPKVGTWLGATPEKLLEVERNRFRTMALAGTQKFADNLDVEWGEKEREEQKIVTDSILDNLKEIVNNIKISGPFTTRAGALLHLKTDIAGEIISDKGNLKKLIAALHPTPAVCGLPKKEAGNFILANEDYDREFYTGFLGEINMKHEVKRSSNRRNQENQAYSSFVPKTSLFVNLRCMKITEEGAEIFVGGGITKESVPESEWEETQNKAGTMKAVLDIDRK